MIKSAAFLLVSSLVSGCICTEIACGDGVSVGLVDPGNWAPGTYRLSFVTPERTATVRCTLPAKPSDPATPRQATCDQAIGVEANPFPDSSWSFRVPGTPASVRVTVERDGVALGDQSITPSYDEHQPNGPYCAPTCRTASGTITL